MSILYLDTSDYLNIFYEKGYGPYNRTLDRLVELREQGVIRIGYSFLIVAEFITKPDARHREERVRRGELLKKICGPNTFPPVWDIKNGATFPNGGRWWLRKDEVPVSANWMRSKTIASFEKEVLAAKPLNRQARRKLLRNGGMKHLLKNDNSSWGLKKSDYGDLPVSDDFIQSNLMARFLRGDCSDREFEARIALWASDPAEFTKIIYDYANSENMIDKMLGGKLDQLEKFAQKVAQIYASIRRSNEDRLALRRNLVEKGFDPVAARRLLREVKGPVAVGLDTSIPRLEEELGKERASHFSHYLAKLVQGKIQFKRSDFMDLMHLCYAYDCSYFRADAAMGNTFKDFEPFKERIVTKFHSLPDIIERSLVQNTKSFEPTPLTPPPP